MKKKLLFIVMFFIISISLTESLRAQVSMDFESGIVSTVYNDVRIPGNEGTLISFKNDLKPSINTFYRIRLIYTINKVHNLSLLYAPLNIESRGRIFGNVKFAEKTFSEDLLTGYYKFNSYRLTYRYDFFKSPSHEFGLGLTAKIRDARIAISSQYVTAEKTNIGFVPIINFRLLMHLNDELGFLFDGDALAAKQGRAIDVLLAATYSLSKRIIVKVGYRILEGGTENSEVYNFALINYLSAGLSYTF